MVTTGVNQQIEFSFRLGKDIYNFLDVPEALSRCGEEDK